MLLHELLSLIKKKHDIEFKDIPCCPKRADAVCASMTGKCIFGNKKDCHQRLMFYRNKSPFFIDVAFVSEVGGKEGFVNDTDLSIKNLKARKII